MSFKIPTFWKVLAHFGPFLLLVGKLSVSASHRFSGFGKFSMSVRTAVRTDLPPRNGTFFESFKVSLQPTAPAHLTIYHDKEDHIPLQHFGGDRSGSLLLRPQGRLTNKFQAQKNSSPSGRRYVPKKGSKNQRSIQHAAATVPDRGNSQYTHTHRLPSSAGRGESRGSALLQEPDLARQKFLKKSL